MLVKKRMTHDPVVVSPRHSLADALRLTRERRIRHLPGVDADRVVVGIVSIGDVVKSRLLQLEHENAALAEYITGR